MYLSKGKRTLADISVTGELFAKFGDFNPHRLVSRTTTVLILEEECRCRRRATVFLREDCHACDVY